MCNNIFHDVLLTRWSVRKVSPSADSVKCHHNPCHCSWHSSGSDSLYRLDEQALVLTLTQASISIVPFVFATEQFSLLCIPGLVMKPESSSSLSKSILRGTVAGGCYGEDGWCAVRLSKWEIAETLLLAWQLFLLAWPEGTIWQLNVPISPKWKDWC